MPKKVSQREENYKGGIKVGTSATTKQSRKLDRGLREASNIALERLAPDYPTLRVVRQLKSRVENGTGCAPDGGVWYLGDRLIAVFEAKHQGIGGNAIERWAKNASEFWDRAPRSSYVTFLTGNGADDKGTSAKTLNGTSAVHGHLSAIDLAAQSLASYALTAEQIDTETLKALAENYRDVREYVNCSPSDFVTEWNSLNPCGHSFYRSPTGFDLDYITDVMVDCIRQTIQKLS